MHSLKTEKSLLTKIIGTPATNMSIYLITFIVLTPIILEIIYDKWMWSQGKDDKPTSTIARIVYFIFIGIFFSALDIATVWQGALYAFGVHFLCFDFILNITREKSPWYHSKADKETFYGFIYRYPTIEYFFKFIVYYSTWAAFYHLNWITGDYPTKLIEYFQI